MEVKKFLEAGLEKPGISRTLVQPEKGREGKIQDHELITELIKPFDIIAIQEVKSDLWRIREIMKSLNEPFRMVITDVGGNYERLAFTYMIRLG